MSAVRELPARPSLDSLRKQAKKLARDVAAEDREASARVHAQLAKPRLPLSNRDAQLVIAREYGFAGWKDLTAEVEKRLGRGLDWAAAQAEVAIHNHDTERLRALLAEYPALVAWRDGDHTLLDATTSYAMDCLDPERERTFTRPAAAEMLIDAGGHVEPKTWEHVIKSGSRGMLQLFARKNAIPRTLPVLAALGDDEGVRARLDEAGERDDGAVIGRALMNACRFKHVNVAQRLLERGIALHPELGRRIDRWQSRDAFVEFLAGQPGLLWHGGPDTTPWQLFVIEELARARDRNDLAAFRRWLDDEPWVLERAFISVQTRLLVPACYQKDRAAFIAALLERDPAMLHTGLLLGLPLFVQALSYGNAYLVPVLARISPLPDDLPHAAGVGDAVAVARWFDNDGKPTLGPLADHYPHSDPQFPRADLHWGPPTTQQTLDIALAWAVLNQHFAIAEFLLARGADISTDWATHEPASILHEATIQGNEAAVRFLIAHGADLDKKDYRWRSNAEGWARYGSNDQRMAELLAEAAKQRQGPR